MILLFRTIGDVYRKEKPMSHYWGMEIDPIYYFKIFLNLYVVRPWTSGAPGDPYLQDTKYLSTGDIVFVTDNGSTVSPAHLAG